MPVVDLLMDFTDAVCVTSPYDYWLSEDSEDQLKARTLCRGCPARMECTLYIKKAKPSFGVWAGRVYGAALKEIA